MTVVDNNPARNPNDPKSFTVGWYGPGATLARTILAANPPPAVDYSGLRYQSRYGRGTPPSTLGHHGDTYTDIASGEIWMNVNGAWVDELESLHVTRVVTGTTDTPTVADDNGTIAYSASGAVTVTANDLGAGISYRVQQRGAGIVTMVAGGGATLLSNKGSPIFATAQKTSVLSVSCDGAGNVYVVS